MRHFIARRYPALLIGLAGLLTLVMLFPSHTPVAPRPSSGAELYVVVNGHERVVQRFANDGRAHRFRLVSLKYSTAANGGYGPSVGGVNGFYGVRAWYRWTCQIGSDCYAQYDQQYVGSWYLSAVARTAVQNYMTVCNGNGFVEPACQRLNRHVGNFFGFMHGYYQSVTRDSRNVMWQYNYQDNWVTYLCNHLDGNCWYTFFWGEMHMMGDGTMWWDAGSWST